jgi:hypothetical protein
MADATVVRPAEENALHPPAAPENVHPGSPVPRPLQFLVAGYVVAMFVMILYFLIKLWPLPDATDQTSFLWGDISLPADVRLILIAALGGALGAYVHLATSFADYAGNEQLTTNWAWWYLLRPFIGMSLAEIVYVAIRGGLLTSGSATTGAISPYGVAAITALTGLFSKQATDKLREVFETLFRTEQKVERKDPLRTTGASDNQSTDGDTSKAQAKVAGA